VFSVNLAQLEFFCYDLANLRNYDFPLILFNLDKTHTLEGNVDNDVKKELKSRMEDLNKIKQFMFHQG
jgi:hypothetical protein